MIYLLKAIKALVNDGIGVYGTIVGDGPEYKRLSKFIKKNKLENFVDLKGPCPSEYIRDLFDATDLFVLPCIVAKNGDQDATPTSLLEAMAMKIPVISTAVGGIPEIIPDGCGFIIPEKDTPSLVEAIKKVAKMSVTERKAIGEAGRNFVADNFDIKMQADKLVDLFKRC
jgi:glycosyltransferase involved in cell wall biosynthesis